MRKLPRYDERELFAEGWRRSPLHTDDVPIFEHRSGEQLIVAPTGIRKLPHTVPTEVTVRLFDRHIMKAERIGNERQDTVRSGAMHRARLNRSDSALRNHIVGAAGEIAVAIAMGDSEFTPHVGKYRSERDVHGVEVRTGTNGRSPLVIRDHDESAAPFVLVTVGIDGDDLFEHATLRGWLYGHEAKEPGFIADPGYRGPAYFVPQFLLRPVGSVPADEPYRIR